MKCKVTLYDAGATFDEIVIARNYQQAKEKALARNPGSTHLTTTAIFDDEINHNNSYSVESPVESQYKGFSSGSSSDGSGMISLLLIGGGCWILYEAWKFVSYIAISTWQWIVGVGQWLWGLFSWMPFMYIQILVGLIYVLVFSILIHRAIKSL